MCPVQDPCKQDALKKKQSERNARLKKMRKATKGEGMESLTAKLLIVFKAYAEFRVFRENKRRGGRGEVRGGGRGESEGQMKRFLWVLFCFVHASASTSYFEATGRRPPTADRRPPSSRSSVSSLSLCTRHEREIKEK